MDEIDFVAEVAIGAGAETLKRYAATLLAQPPSDEEGWESPDHLTSDEAVLRLMLERLWNAAPSRERRLISRDLLVMAAAIRARHLREPHDELWAASMLEAFVHEKS